MFRPSILAKQVSAVQRRLMSNASGSKRFLQTINHTATNMPYNYVKMETTESRDSTWSKHSLRRPLRSLNQQQNQTIESAEQTTQQVQPVKTKRRRQLKPRKALVTLTPTAVSHLKQLLDQPDPQYIKVGVKNRGCSGLSYHLEYVSKPDKFDEVVPIDESVKIIIDSKALFSVIGSEMDYVDDKLSSRFVFKNPNAKGSCGCGESFMV